MDMIAYAAILAIIAPLSVITWLVVTGDRAGVRNIQSNLGNRPQNRGPVLGSKGQLAAWSLKVTPTGYTGWLDTQLAGAGRPKARPLARLVTVNHCSRWPWL
jgi:tight adherence protein C